MYLLAKGRKKVALDLLNQAIVYSPFDAEIFYDTGIIYSDLNDNKTAIEYFRKAIKLDTEFASAYNNLCYTLALEGEFNEALDYCKNAVRLDEKSFAAYDSLGFVYAGLKDYEKALENYETALKLNNKVGEIYFHYAQALQNKGNLQNAITNYQMASELDKKYKKQSLKEIKKCKMALETGI